MDHLEQFQPSAFGQVDFPALDKAIQSAQVHHRAMYEVFEAEREAIASRSESSPLVLWAKSSLETRTDDLIPLANRVRLGRS